MHKPYCLLKKTIVLLSLFAGFFGGVHVEAQIINPPKKKVPEFLLLCDGNQLKESKRNPTCKGWEEAAIDTSEYSLYQSNYPRACGYGVDNNFRCYFVSPQSACKAFAKIQGIVHPNLSTPFCGCGAYGASDKTTFRCAWCEKGEMGCSNEKFITPDVCSGNTHIISYVQIPPGAYLSYCDDAVSGPYSNFPDQYQVCGTTYTETFAGMVFTEDQKQQIRQINKTKNSITENGKYKSDLSGFCYKKPDNQPCIKPHPTLPGFCVEPGEDANELLTTATTNAPNSAQVHHVIPKSDGRSLNSCPCGKNSMSNAAIISAQLNRVLSNKDRKTFLCEGVNELDFVNALPKYSYP